MMVHVPIINDPFESIEESKNGIGQNSVDKNNDIQHSNSDQLKLYGYNHIQTEEITNSPIPALAILE